jgi:hypothetical protein
MLNLGIPTDSALKQLDLLTLDANKRRRILRGAGRQVRRDTKARLKGQKGLSGTNWQGRSDGRKKRMLKNWVKVFRYTPHPITRRLRLVISA